MNLPSIDPRVFFFFFTLLESPVNTKAAVGEVGGEQYIHSQPSTWIVYSYPSPSTLKTHDRLARVGSDLLPPLSSGRSILVGLEPDVS